MLIVIPKVLGAAQLEQVLDADEDAQQRLRGEGLSTERCRGSDTPPPATCASG